MIHIVSNVQFITSELSIFTEISINMYFTGPYLRVTTPKTTNGLIPLLRNGQQVTREDFLPLSAKKSLESKNNRLRKSGNTHLVAEIEVVSGIAPAEPVKRTRKTKTQ